MIAPAVPSPDDKDWTWVLERPCPECGFDASTLLRTELAALVQRSAASFRAALAADDAAQRPAPDVWSPLEYGCHVRDVCTRFGERLALMLAEDDPQFANWDQDETALADRYWTQQPAVVSEELTDAASAIATAFASVPGGAWDRPGRRSNGSVFTVDTLGRYFAHDLVHHAHDIGRPIH
jgi:hypothetical protein